ncbi:hypothetical protein GGI07_005746 [Coemansia sp. Benny D115]|nr:hypothetical protein GGI07_005746 [Coemansia sp. Benny D115]
MVETVAVIGATGAQGGSVVKALSALPDKYKVRGITRDASSPRVQKLKAQYPNVDWVSANLNSQSSLEAAFANADIVFGNTSFLDPEIIAKVDAGDKEAEVRQGKHMVDAAVAQGVKHIVYSSLLSPKEVSGGRITAATESEGKHEIEMYIRSLSDKIKGYFVYPAFYFQNLLYVAKWEETADGERQVVFTYPLPENSRQPYVDIEEDMGNTVELVLSDRARFEGQGIAASQGFYSGGEIAEAYTRATGVKAVYRYGKIPEFDREDINAMMQFYVEYEDALKVGDDIARNGAPRAFVDADGFWKRYASFRPEN